MAISIFSYLAESAVLVKPFSNRSYATYRISEGLPAHTSFDIPRDCNQKLRAWEEGGPMADVVEKKLDMSLDQIADERKHELRSHQQKSQYERSSSVVSNSSDGGGNFRPRDGSASPRDHFGGKARTSYV